jgi:hydrogenase small subunit
LEYCTAVTATLALPSSYAEAVAEALGQPRKPVLVWLEFQDCAGNTEAMLRSSHPSVEDIVLETLSWEYHETIMAGYGKAAEAALNRVVREEKGKYLAVVEGSIPTADDGVYCTIAGRTALDIAREVCGSAAANIAVGACAWDGGLVRSNPSPTGALGLQDAVPGLKVVNLPGCPHNAANTAAVLVHYLTFGECQHLILLTGRYSLTGGSFTTNASAGLTMTRDVMCRRGVTRDIAKGGAFTRWAVRARRQLITARPFDGMARQVGP